MCVPGGCNEDMTASIQPPVIYCTCMLIKRIIIFGHH